MDDSKERLAIINWIQRAIDHSEMTPAAIGKAVWPHDRSILGKILKNRRRAQVGELAEIAAVTGYPAYLSGDAPETKRDPAPRRKNAFYVREWREDSEESESRIARTLGLDLDIYQEMERRPYNFSEDQVKIVAATLNIDFNRMRFPPNPRENVSRSKERVVKKAAPEKGKATRGQK